VDQNNPFLFEIINANQDSFDEWFSATAPDTSHLPHHTLLQPYEGFTYGFTLDDLCHSCNTNPHNDSCKLDKNNFTERLRDKIDVMISENPLRVQGGMRKRLMFIKSIEQDDELEECY
jgi:hypothetical protein